MGNGLDHGKSEGGEAFGIPITRQKRNDSVTEDGERQQIQDITLNVCIQNYKTMLIVLQFLFINT